MSTFRILAIDGGGIRGAFASHILHMVQKRLGINLADSFSMIAGTSTGSIVAAAIAKGVDIEKVTELYKKHGAEVFSRKRRLRLLPRKYQPALASRYSKKALETRLTELFGDTKLGQVTIPLLIPATDIGNGGVHVFKSGYSAEFVRDPDVLVREAILASCSAPTFFDPTMVDNYLLADGGLWANNPSLAAVIDAQKRLGISKEDIKILSIGTGHAKTCYGVNSDRKWGLMNGWKGTAFIDFLLSLQAQSTHNYLQLLLQSDQVVRLNFESDCPLPMDDYRAVDDLISNADRVFTHNSQTIRTIITT